MKTYLLIFLLYFFLFQSIPVYANFLNKPKEKKIDFIISPLNIVLAPENITTYPGNKVFGFPSYMLNYDISEMTSPEKKKTPCIVCFNYGGSRPGIEEKFWKIYDFLEQNGLYYLKKFLWIVRVPRLNNNKEKYALIFKPYGIDKNEVYKITRELAIRLKKTIKDNNSLNLNSLATPICNSQYVLRYQPKNPRLEMANEAQLSELLNQIYNAQNFLHEQISKTTNHKDQVLLAMYDKEKSQLIPLIIPRDSVTYKDKETNLVIVKDDGYGVGTSYYIGNAPDITENFSNHYSLPAIAFPVEIPYHGIEHIVNTPFSDDFNTSAMAECGLDYLINVIEEVIIELMDRQVPSTFLKNKTIDEVLPNDILTVLISINIIEHMDHGDYLPYIKYSTKGRRKIFLGVEKDMDIELKKVMAGQLRKALVILAANKGNAYSHSLSKSGARGLSQIIKKTYESLRKLYKKAELNPDFYKGTRSHHTSIMAQALHIDSELATLCKNKILEKEFRKYQDHRTISFFDLIIAGYNFSAPKLKQILISKNGLKKNWKQKLPWETQLYIFKAQYVRNRIDEMLKFF